MNASTETAAVGYDIFLVLHANSIITLGAINEALANVGREPIQQRTLTHYFKLLENGIVDYIPINQFDVLHGRGMV
jgi:hypothetical protein